MVEYLTMWLIMNNLEKYNKAFCDIFNVDVTELNEGFTANVIERWDSITQMSLVNQLEDSFEIMLEVDDIIELVSYEKGKKILEKYSIQI